jgi:hypothetical protein
MNIRDWFSFEMFQIIEREFCGLWNIRLFI